MSNVTIKDSKAFRRQTPDVRRAMAPLLKIASALASSIGKRVGKSGKTFRGGKFEKYPGVRFTRKGDIWYTWVGEGYLRPPGATVKRRDGKKLVGHDGGWAYESRQVYQQAHGGPRQHNFAVTGGMWNGLTVKAMSPTRVRILFTGKSVGITGKKTSNKEKAQYGMQHDKVNPLRPSNSEMRAVVQFCQINMFDAVVKNGGPTPWDKMMAAEFNIATSKAKLGAAPFNPRMMKMLRQGGWRDKKLRIKWRN